MTLQGCVTSPIQQFIETLYRRHKDVNDGVLAGYIPDPAWFGICIVTVDGQTYQVGDTGQPFTIQSISKPFLYGLALESRGLPHVLSKIGVEPSGDAFNAISLHPATGRPYDQCRCHCHNIAAQRPICQWPARTNSGDVRPLYRP